MNVLDADQLAALAASFADDPASWAPRVRADAERRVCEPLLRAPNATVWLLCWMPGQHTGFHDHDGAAGAVAVVRGRVIEERLRLGGSPLQRELGPGEQLGFTGSTIHSVSHAAGAPAVTIHAYSPALRRMGQYDFEASGELRRLALDEDTELGRDEVRVAAPASASVAWRPPIAACPRPRSGQWLRHGTLPASSARGAGERQPIGPTHRDDH